MYRPLRPCNKIGCKNLTHDRYCGEHIHLIKQSRKEADKTYDKYKRDKESKAFYQSKQWKMMRKRMFAKHKGLCVKCKENDKIVLADVVDHIIPYKVDKNKRLDEKNLQTLCHRCHNQKTAEDSRKYGVGGMKKV